MIADALKNKLPNIKSATIHVVLRNNNCTAAAFLNDSTRKLAEGGDYPPVKSNGCFADPNIWQRNNKTSVVGLAPLSSSSISYSQIVIKIQQIRSSGLLFVYRFFLSSELPL